MSIEVRDLCFAYGARPILEHVSFTLREGRLVSLLGPNGVGKSTLFKCMLGILPGYTGTITLEGKDVRALDMKSLSRRIAYIPQSHYPAFNYSVFDMVLMGTSARVSSFSPPGKKEEANAMAALERVGIADFAARDFMRISGGERQLVLIARALAQQSRILVMDEPTANLDYGNQMRVMACIRALTDDGYTVVQSTHNPDQSYLFSHEILAMHDGRILAQGVPQDVMTSELIATLYNIDVRVESLYNDQVRVCVPDYLTQKGDQPS